jgi:type IV secretory pathway TraG/TraD family ATPase VirD4
VRKAEFLFVIRLLMTYLSSPSPDNPITLFAETDFRHRRARFGIKRSDRRAHMYIVGKTGTGKSTLLETLIKSDLKAGQGLALIDPHGDLVERVVRKVPESRRDDLIYFDVPDTVNPLAFNPLAHVAPGKRPLAASGMLSAFKSIWADSWGPRLEHILRNALLALLDQPEGATLADIPRLLDDAKFRQIALSHVRNDPVREFWMREYASYPARFRAEAVAPLQNKVGAFLSNPVLNRILTSGENSFRFRQVMDEGRVVLVNLAKGKIGEDTASLLGSLLVSRISLAALSRADLPEAERLDFHLYLDEFPLVITPELARMMAELRKYHVSLTLAHQHLSQLNEPLRDAVLGNAGTIIAFRLGAVDAETLAREFYPEITSADLINLPNHHFYIKLMIDNRVSHPFSAQTIPPDG